MYRYTNGTVTTNTAKYIVKKKIKAIKSLVFGGTSVKKPFKMQITVLSPSTMC